MSKRNEGQTLASTNAWAKAVVKSVMIEVLTGVHRERKTNRSYSIDFTISGGKLVVDVRDSETHGHYGSWEVTVKPM